MSDGDMFRRVSSGERITLVAGTMNAMLDAAVSHRASRSTERQASRSIMPPGMVYIQNDSGSDVDQFAVLGIDAPLFAADEDGFFDAVTLSCIIPIDTHAGRFVVCAEPIASGDIGRAWVYGVCQAQVNILHEATWYARLTADAAYLTSGSGGSVRILSKPAGTGLLWCIVQLGITPMPPWARLTDAAAINSSTDTWRWQYAWEEVIWSGAGSTALTGGRSGTTSEGYALNGMEVPNTTSGVVNGVNIDSSGDYPPGFMPRPLTYGDKAVLVRLHETIDASGDLVYRLSQPGGHDGTCEAPA